MGKRHKPEEIIAKRRQVEVMSGQGGSMADAIGVTEITYSGTASTGHEARSCEASEGAGVGERAAAQGGLGTDAGQGKRLSPSRQRACIDHVRRERRACKALG